MLFPQGYHITWGTYGARLPGSTKPHVTKKQNVYGTPLPETDAYLEDVARFNMVQPAVRLTLGQRRDVEQSIVEVAERYRWTIHAVAPQTDHVHVVITAPRIGIELRDAIKACSTRLLNERYRKQRWWARGG